MDTLSVRRVHITLAALLFATTIAAAQTTPDMAEGHAFRHAE